MTNVTNETKLTNVIYMTNSINVANVTNCTNVTNIIKVVVVTVFLWVNVNFLVRALFKADTTSSQIPQMVMMVKGTKVFLVHIYK